MNNKQFNFNEIQPEQYENKQSIFYSFLNSIQ